jgi:hypothetical protein
MTVNRFGAVSLALSLTLAVAPFARGSEIFGYDPARHDRFTGGFAAAPIVNTNLLGGLPGLDLSGVGWNPANAMQNAALITPQHIVLANHFRFGGPPASITFLNRDGVLKTYAISSYLTTTYPGGSTSDLLVAQLSAPIAAADNITVYPVVRPLPFGPTMETSNPQLLDFYRGKDIIVVGQNQGPGGARIGRNTIDDLGTFNFGSGSPNTDTGGLIWQSVNQLDSVRLVGGDSGSPDFLYYNGQLSLIGANAGIDTTVNPQLNASSFIPFYVDQINALIAGTGFSINIIVVPIPEPGVLLLLSATAGFVVLRRRRARAA